MNKFETQYQQLESCIKIYNNLFPTWIKENKLGQWVAIPYYSGTPIFSNTKDEIWKIVNQYDEIVLVREISHTRPTERVDF